MSGVHAVGRLRSLRAQAALDGVSWVQSGLVEIAVGRLGRVLQNPRRHLLPPSGVAPLGRLRAGFGARLEARKQPSAQR